MTGAGSLAALLPTNQLSQLPAFSQVEKLILSHEYKFSYLVFFISGFHTVNFYSVWGGGGWSVQWGTGVGGQLGLQEQSGA